MTHQTNALYTQPRKCVQIEITENEIGQKIMIALYNDGSAVKWNLENGLYDIMDLTHPEDKHNA